MKKNDKPKKQKYVRPALQTVELAASENFLASGTLYAFPGAPAPGGGTCTSVGP